MKHIFVLAALCFSALIHSATAQAATAQAATRSAPADGVVAAEREFAGYAATHGWVAAFKKYAAADGIVLRPEPINAKESLATQPDEPADTSLKWWPVWAGIAKSGDLGFTTGPFTVGDDKGFGHYFTVWAKQNDGTWRWIFDGGPRNDAKSTLGPTTEPAQLSVATVSSGTAEKAWAEVGSLEAMMAAVAATNARSAYAAHLAVDARVMGSPAQPAVGRTASLAEIETRGPTMDMKPLGGRASSAGDFVFTYGSATWAQNGAPRSGYYVRIWQKRIEGWRLLFDEVLAKPPRKAD
jgi:ketosteroid isomerase-like protein